MAKITPWVKECIKILSDPGHFWGLYIPKSKYQNVQEPIRLAVTCCQDFSYSMPDFQQGWWPLQAWYHSRSRETLRGLGWVNWSVDLVARMNQAVVLKNVDGLTFFVADLISWHGGIWLLIEDENVDIDRVTNGHTKKQKIYLLSLPSVHYWKHTNPKVLSSCDRKSAKNHDQLSTVSELKHMTDHVRYPCWRLFSDC